jgi:hypothetical protein
MDFVMKLRGTLPPGRDVLRDGVTGRDGYILKQALAYAIAADAGLPEELQSPSNRADMLALLTALFRDKDELQHELDTATETMCHVGHIQQTPPQLDRRPTDRDDGDVLA